LTIPEILDHPWISLEKKELEELSESFNFKLPNLEDMIKEQKPFTDTDKPICDINLDNLYLHCGDQKI